MSPMRILTLVALAGLVGCQETAKPRLVAGERLAVESWVHGSLSLPWRFVDTHLGAACTVESLDGEPRCVPANPVVVAIGYVDAECSAAVMAPNDAYAPGDLVTDWSLDGSVLGVYRVGEPLEDGPIHRSGTGCTPHMPVDEGPRWALEPVAPTELVAFRRRTEVATGKLTVELLVGDDGSELVDSVRHHGDECLLVGDVCVRNRSGLSFVYPSERAYTDGECAQHAVHRTASCTSEGSVLIAEDECGEWSLLGRAGEAASEDVYVVSPAGLCLRDEVGDGCAQTVDPPREVDFPRLDEVVATDDGLELVTLSAGRRVIEARFRLPEGLECEPARTEDGERRCVPLRQISPPPHRDDGLRYVTPEGCDGEGGLPLYAFGAGRPCSMVTDASYDRDVPEVTRIERLVPYGGDLYTKSILEGTECLYPVSSEGWFVSEEAAPSEFPVLEPIVR